MTEAAWPVPTIDEAVREHARTRPGDLAVAGPGRSLTWAELDAAADRCAGHLARAGVGPGSRVGWLGGNDPAFPVVLLAAWRRRASFVGLNWRLPVAAQRDVAEFVELAYLISGPGFEEDGAAIAAGITAHTAASLWESEEPVAPLDPDPEDEAIVYFTSGSTGRPKAVPFTRLVNELGMGHPTPQRFTHASRQLIVPPTFHLAGATWVQYGLRYGTTQYYIAGTSPDAVLDALVEHRITHTVLVPTLIRVIVDRLKAGPRPLPALEHVAYGTSPITMTLLREAVELLGCEFCQVYGMTEAGCPVAFLHPEDHAPGEAHAARRSSAGRITPGVEVSVRDLATGAELPAGSSGVVYVRSPFMMRGYLNADEITAAVMTDGWLNTRDVGHLDEDGYLYVEGRSDHMIVSGGENVHPNEVEDVIDRLPDVLECAVYGAPDPLWGRRVTAVIVRRDERLTEEAVLEHCRAALAGYKVPKSVRFVPELPKTATGKVVRASLE